MSEELDPASAEFARRARSLLEASAAALPARTRSRLTRARYAALEQHAAGRMAGTRALWQRALPAGAVSAAVLGVLLLVAAPHAPQLQQASVTGAAGGDDLELLADRDALALAQDAGTADADADVDYEFYAWAVSAAQDDAGTGVGS